MHPFSEEAQPLRPPEGVTAQPAPEPESWGAQFRLDDGPAAEPAAAAVDSEDVYSEDDLLELAGMAVGLVAVPGDRFEAYAGAIETATAEGGKAKKMLAQLELGRALAEMGITPSRGVRRLPAWARVLGGLGAIAYVVAGAYQQAMAGAGSGRSDGGPGVDRSEGVAGVS